ncbi:CDP-diacylglycerol--glycerol-3-phosphate 3-phosphatidyltransferase [Rhodovulum sp. 12E13]|uniref:CDP-diacylglycerol--glycerol-3-phosphate 3-phosphatidyltransferase n=1 Tax=Rhodovulum sp. 12E13 TaxID=2203891 RepID=UPI000E16FC03|nr:CDP-diacylglycerol--glycerol-3-phosphate 3-phosphatidyltransferase [Rhodovulum sp. 12E13]RDC72088.1 CDP-diacylglycerol--glycerol-3-phosphate 3-phosphatidyltransferase [Rhodovulum sp. 12E13]
MRLNLPNILTIIRLIAAPGVAVAFLYFNRPGADWFALLLFVAAAATDWIDGRLARAWGQETKLGTMLDPIADKAMVVIALAVIIGFSGLAPWILLPATVILFREVFVSGLREFLGDVAGELKVTNLAKWKTTVQMVAIAVLFAQGVFEHYIAGIVYGMGEETMRAVLDGRIEDTQGLIPLTWGLTVSWYGGVVLLWVAAALTALTGWDYFNKARPYLRDEEEARG